MAMLSTLNEAAQVIELSGAEVSVAKESIHGTPSSAQFCPDAVSRVSGQEASRLSLFLSAKDDSLRAEQE